MTDDLHALLGERRQHVVHQAMAVLRHLLAHDHRDPRELVLRGQAVRRALGEPGGDLPLEAGHAHLEELIEVAAVDAEELEALEERGTGIERLVQDAPVELEPAELAIDIERRMPDVEVEQGRRWCWRCRGRCHRLDHRHGASVTASP